MSKSRGVLVAVILAIFLLSWLAIYGLELGDFTIYGAADRNGIRQGLDLVGGSAITFEAEIPSGTSGEDQTAGMDAAVEMLRKRLDAAGYQNATISRTGEVRIHVEIPNETDPERAIQLLGSTAELTFRDSDGNILLHGSDVQSAVVKTGKLDQNSATQTYVELTFKPEAREAFKNATREAAGKPDGNNFIALYLDENMVQAPEVGSEYASTGIDSDSCVVTFGRTENNLAAKEFADLVNIGKLPFKLNQVELDQIGPSLGAQALDTSLLAALIGFILVALFMIVFYRLPGLLSVLALCGYASIVALIMANFHINLTLPGIAGVILGVGMAVDANVIIFERIKEELNSGKTVKSAINSGYSRALTAIIDSNITTIIAAVVLWWQGTGSVQSFAITLFISVLVSMFTAVLVSRWIFGAVMQFNIKNLWLFGVKERGNQNG